MSHWDKLAVSAPLNRTAAVVTSGSRTLTWKGPKAVAEHLHSAEPIPTRPFRSDQENLAGRRFGRFTVIGYIGKSASAKGARWLVRCACGMHEARSSKSINNPANEVDCCRSCRHLEYLKRRDRKLSSLLISGANS